MSSTTFKRDLCSLPYEMQRSILEFTQAGFEPLKRVCKMFLAFERMPKRIEAATQVQELDEYQSIPEGILKRLPYVSSVQLIRWACDEMKMPCDALLCEAVVYEGVDINVLQWLRAQDPPCPWNEETCGYAAVGGHLKVLQWLRAQDPPCPWDEETCSSAAENGHLEVLQWLRAQDPPCPWNA